MIQGGKELIKCCRGGQWLWNSLKGSQIERGEIRTELVAAIEENGVYVLVLRSSLSRERREIGQKLERRRRVGSWHLGIGTTFKNLYD